MVISILKTIMISILSDKFVRELIVHALEKLAKKSDNKVDDELVALVSKALLPAEQSQPKEPQEPQQ
jgi:chaperonin GroEL (HSP60 family)